jgi:hypothetical protein
VRFPERQSRTPQTRGSKFDRTTPIEKISHNPASGLFIVARSVNPRLGKESIQYVEGVLKDAEARERAMYHDITGE